MKAKELNELRSLINKEIERRERVKDLLKDKLVSEYLELTNTSKEELDSENLKEILNEILKTYKITETNGIYVCTSAYYMDCYICYEETNYCTRNVDIDSDQAEYKIYTDIESGNSIKATKGLQSNILIGDFERDHIVLNPCNTNEKMNGYQQVRDDFFINAIKDGQAKSKKLILNKYPRLIK